VGIEFRHQCRLGLKFKLKLNSNSIYEIDGGLGLWSCALVCTIKKPTPSAMNNKGGSGVAALKAWGFCPQPSCIGHTGGGLHAHVAHAAHSTHAAAGH